MTNTKEVGLAAAKEYLKLYWLASQDKTEESKRIFPGLRVMDYGYAVVFSANAWLVFMPLPRPGEHGAWSISWIWMYYAASVFLLVGGIMIIIKSKKINNFEQNSAALIGIMVGVLGQTLLLIAWLVPYFLELKSLIDSSG